MFQDITALFGIAPLRGWGSVCIERVHCNSGLSECDERLHTACESLISSIKIKYFCCEEFSLSICFIVTYTS